MVGTLDINSWGRKEKEGRKEGRTVEESLRSLIYANNCIINILHFQYQRLSLADFAQKVFIGFLTGLL